MELICRIKASFENSSETWLYVACALLYLLGIWEHANGGIYTDITAVYLNRFCTPLPCVTSGLPYVNYFVEYPPITGFFICTMGLLAHLVSFPGRTLLTNYYEYSAIFLLLPTLVLVSELLKIADIIGVQRKYRTIFLYFVATPSFVFMLLLNWYIIGASLTVWGLRKYMEGLKTNGTGSQSEQTKKLLSSGLLFGLSAVANLVTALPALGIVIFGCSGLKQRVIFLAGLIAVLLAAYLPLIYLSSFPHVYLNSQHVLVSYKSFAFPNFDVISDYFQYQQSWYVEGSWMLSLFNSTNSLRHVVFPAVFSVLFLLILAKSSRLQKFYATDQSRFVLFTGALFTFAFLFSSYVCTPQMNVVLLPFFVLVPFLKRNYWEFLVFEIVNSLVIVWGFSTPLAFLGINFAPPVAFGSPWASPIQLLAVVRSLWIGKYLIYDGLLKWEPIQSTVKRKAIEIANLSS